MKSTFKQQMEMIQTLRKQKEQGIGFLRGSNPTIPIETGAAKLIREQENEIKILKDVYSSLNAIQQAEKNILALPKLLELSERIVKGWNTESYVKAGNAVRELKDLLKTLK